MLNQAAILNYLTTPRTKNWVEGLCTQLCTQGFDITDLLNLTLYPTGQVAFHAVWLLDTIVLSDLPRYANNIELFISYSQRIKHHSCQRHYARIFMYFTGSKNEIIKAKLAQTDLEPVVELCFDWLINTKVKVAVKASAAEVLCNVSSRYNWVTEELQNQLRFLMINGSPAIQATGHRLLNKLK